MRFVKVGSNLAALGGREVEKEGAVGYLVGLHHYLVFPTVNREDRDLVRTVLRHHLLVDLVKVIHKQVAIGAARGIEFNKDVLLGRLAPCHEVFIGRDILGFDP